MALDGSFRYDSPVAKQYDSSDQLRADIRDLTGRLITLADEMLEAANASGSDLAGVALARINQGLIRSRRLRADRIAVDPLDEATWAILSVLYAAHAQGDGPMRLTHIIRETKVPGTTLVVRLSKLEALGLVVRNRIESDLRQNQTQLSASAIAQFEAYLTAVAG